MRRLGVKGVLRGKKVATPNPDTSQPCPDDIGVLPKAKAPLVNRLFMADRPNKLWVSDFTYVQTWSGTVYAAFVIDVFARRIAALRVLHAKPFRVTVWRA
jgi:transposase InsO family protein